MSIFKKAFILGAVAFVVCAFSYSKTTKNNFVPKNALEAVLEQNTLLSQGNKTDWSNRMLKRYFRTKFKSGS